MSGDWHLGFSSVVTVVEAKAADEGGFVDRDGGEKLGDCHCLLGYKPVEDGTANQLCLDAFLLDRRYSYVRVGFWVDLPQVDLPIFLGNEANKMGPV